MNERIKLLAEQAQIDGDAIHYYSPAFAEKFAELIVKECAKVLEIQGSNTGHEQYHYGASLIEEHFGVK